MVDYLTVDGPLEPERLQWVADLYGRADPKFNRMDVLDHLYARSPAGPGLHCFAVDDGRAVGHCSVVPQRARLGAGELRCGKLEALWIEESHRGRQGDEQPVALALLERLYAFADERGFELLHGSATPRIGRIIGFLPLEGVAQRSLVSVVTPEALSATELRTRGRLVARAQGALRGLASAGASGPGRGLAHVLRPPEADDVDLAAAPPPPPGRWTVLAQDAWDWYRAAPLVRVLELPGPHGARALIQLPGSAREPVRIVGWRPARGGVRAAVLLLAAAARVARESGAATLRFQPWEAPAGDGGLARAARLLGFLPRADLTVLWVQTHDPRLARAEAVVASPVLALAF